MSRSTLRHLSAKNIIFGFVLVSAWILALLVLAPAAAFADPGSEPSPDSSVSVTVPQGESEKIDPQIRYGDGSTVPKSEQTSTPEPPKEPEKPKEPINLPEVKNLETLWLIPLAIIALGGLYFVVTRISSDTRKRAKQQRAEKARQLRLDEIWKKVTDRHDELKGLYLKAETDWDMLFSTPALVDVTVPETADMIQAMDAAENARCPRPLDLTEDQDIQKLSYPRAVNEFSRTWEIALDRARVIGQSSLPAQERKLLREIRQLLTLAENGAASDNERQLAYERARTAIEKLSDTRLSRKIAALVTDQIEMKSRLAITAQESAD